MRFKTFPSSSSCKGFLSWCSTFFNDVPVLIAASKSAVPPVDEGLVSAFFNVTLPKSNPPLTPPPAGLDVILPRGGAIGGGASDISGGGGGGVLAIGNDSSVFDEFKA